MWKKLNSDFFICLIMPILMYIQSPNAFPYPDTAGIDDGASTMLKWKETHELIMFTENPNLPQVLQLFCFSVLLS